MAVANGESSANHVVRGAWIALAIFMILYLMNALDRGLPSLMVGSIKADLGISDLQMSLLLGFAFALFYAICGLPFGWLLDRAPRRVVLYVAVSFWSVAMVACGLATNFTQLFIARMALGCGEAALGPAAHSMLADLFPKKKLAMALSIYTTGAVLGTGLSISIGGLAVAYFAAYEWVELPLFGQVRGWQVVFIICGLPGLLLAFLAFAFREPPRRHLSGATGKPALFPFLRQRLFIYLAGSFALYSMITYGVNLWVAAYMERQFGMGPGVAGPVIGTLNIVTVLIGTIGSGWLVDRLVARGCYDAYLRVFVGSILLGAPVGLIGFLSGDINVFLVCVAVLKLFTFSFIGYGAATFQAISPDTMRAQMGAVYLLMLALIGNGGGPLLIGFLTDSVFQDPAKLGWSIALSIGIIAPIAVTCALLGMKPLREAVRRQMEPALSVQNVDDRGT